MSRSLLFISAMAGTIMAQTSAISSLFLPGFEGSSLLGSVMTANPTMTQYFVQCAPGTDANDCGLGPGVSVTMQPGTYAFDIADPPSFTMSERCVFDQDTAACTTSISGPEANDPGVVTTTLTGVTSDDFLMPVTITANTFTAASVTAAAATSKPAESTADSAHSGDHTSAAPTSTESKTSSSTEAPSPTTAGAPYVTGGAIMAGIIAIMGGALVL
ncbi:hypothetical protein F4779DRAFT_592394 [Xylariaceae sp. FL0662B]|nr:hypothetical protein F4779DRAFT_592394 [Xylariaceae sp. FL0662B]